MSKLTSIIICLNRFPYLNVGGIELAKAKGAMTIGLATIIHNPGMLALTVISCIECI